MDIDTREDVFFEVDGRKIFDVKRSGADKPYCKVSYLLVHYPILLPNNVTQEQFDEAVNKVKEMLGDINTTNETGQFPWSVVH